MVIYLVMMVQRRIVDNKFIGNSIISGHFTKEKAESEIKRIITDLERFGIAYKVDPDDDFHAKSDLLCYDYYVKSLKIQDDGN